MQRAEMGELRRKAEEAETEAAELRRGATARQAAGAQARGAVEAAEAVLAALAARKKDVLSAAAMEQVCNLGSLHRPRCVNAHMHLHALPFMQAERGGGRVHGHGAVRYCIWLV